MAVTRRTGQFFLIGVLIIITMIVGTVLFDMASVTAPETQTPRQLFDRAMAEFPAMVNTVIAEQATANHLQQRLASYLSFQQYLFTSHGMTSRSHALVSIPDGDNATVAVANFRQQQMDGTTLVVGGTSTDLGTVAPGHVELVTVTDVSDRMPVTFWFTTDATVNQSTTMSNDRVDALYTLRVIAESQIWQDTRTY